MRYLKDLSLAGKVVLIRADLNVPLDESGKITDPNRIIQFLPTLKEVTSKNGRAVIMSHFGRPAGKVDPKCSLKVVAEKISELTGQEVKFAADCVGREAFYLADSLEDGEVLVLENLRFHKGEQENNPEFAATLARLADVYVNDAFATAHRAHASIVGVPKHFSEKAAGLLMQNEIDYYEKALVSPAKPLAVVLGGAKVSSKLNALINIAAKADKLIIGGAMANTFLAAQGFQMGRSLYEPELFPKVIELLGTLARRGCQLYLPVDVMVGPGLEVEGLARPVPVQEVPADTMALDIGPATQILYGEALNTAETIVWNGPMGAFEKEEYSQGTFSMIEHMASAHGLTVVGGGDTDAAIHKMELTHKFDYVSTGGGAFLALLEGKDLPGIAALKN